MKIRTEFGALLNRHGLTDTGLELGVYRGEFAEQILDTWQGGELILVDPWRHLPDYLDSWNPTDAEAEDNFLATQVRLARFQSRLVYRRMRSEAAVLLQGDDTLDFIYIDANHSYAHCLADLRMWYSKVKPGGIVAGHDYYNAVAMPDLEPDPTNPWRGTDPAELTSYGVKAAIDEFISDLPVLLNLTEEDLPSWWFCKPH